MKRIYLFLIGGILLFGCQKSQHSGCFTGLRLTAKDSIPFAGDTLIVYANQLDLDYHWSGPNNFFYETSGSNKMEISHVLINQSGWYYCTASVPGCSSYTDSVYIRVQLKQGRPSCSLTNDHITSTTGLPDISAVSVTKSFSASFNAITVHVFAGVGYPVYDFVFNSYNGNMEPKDGIYYTTDVPIFDPQQDADAINMSCSYGPYYFGCRPGQKIYVSHVNGKLRVSFCSIGAGDESGANGLFTGMVTEH